MTTYAFPLGLIILLILAVIVVVIISRWFIEGMKKIGYEKKNK